jgi:quinol monooxygenase YgiN
MLVNREEPGCTGCTLTTELGAQAAISYSEYWKTEDDLKRRLRSDGFAILAELIEQASKNPTIEFTVAGAIRSLDYARETRGP